MPEGPEIVLSAIHDDDLPQVGRFLNASLNDAVSAESWAAAVTPVWASSAPNRGFVLREGERIVGAYLAIYSEQPAGSFCNLAAWCVLEPYRAHGLRLLRAMLGQRGYHFTDFSPSGNVVELNRRLKFVDLDTTTAFTPHLPVPRARRVRVVTDLDRIADILDGDDLRLFEDHREAAGAIHLVLIAGGQHCYLVVRRERRKGLAVFASILHVGNKALFPRVSGALFTHLLLRHRLLATLVEIRVTGHRPALSFLQRAPRSRMYRSTSLGPDDISYLYSELTCVAW